ncbi:cupin domain-containing protein [Chromobacterium alticapitis]|uniref:Cupin n=1 Tax=Chromobacterium alticapitis TaxID=2073169 RepID=A0A2S5DG93_9NEIS|nr:cupin domain-containing protein [Chromobacterium alticapitis]POZ62064.1 cupin [Chromobacterium alticapitis]
MSRPNCVKHWRELENPEAGRYPDSREEMGYAARFGQHFGFARLGVNHLRLEPGRRSSLPHCESTEDELILVLEGAPDVWLDGALHRLQEGDAVGFKAGDGLCHTFINNTEQTVRLLVVGDTRRADNRYHYPLNPERNAAAGAEHWSDAPARPNGSHDGLPDKLRENNGLF